MTLLRRVLLWQAALWGLCGVALAVAPGTVVEGLLDQTPAIATSWLRMLGVAAVVLAAQMVLVGRKIEDLWWWSWSFVILETGTALIAVLTAAFAVPEGAASWPWWLLGAVDAGLAVAGVTALAKAGMERSPV